MSSTMPHTLSALYGLKFNPFTPEIPLEALYVPPRIENFAWRIENAFAREGGFVLITGYQKEIIMKSCARRYGENTDFLRRSFPLFSAMYYRLMWGIHTRRCTCQFSNYLQTTQLG